MIIVKQIVAQKRLGHKQLRYQTSLGFNASTDFARQLYLRLMFKY